MNTHYPHSQKLPKDYITWLKRQSDLDDLINVKEHELPPVPKYEKVKIPFTPATAYAFAKNFINYLMP